MSIRPIHQPPPRARARRRHNDRGFTLIELVIAIVLSSMIGGVVVAALITSLNVARSTTDSVGDSADTGLISTFLIRDAQSSGGIDPTTGRPNPSLGISADPSAPDWAGCTQYIPGVFLADGSPKPATFVVRFSWLDTVSASAVVVTYALVPDPLDSTKPQLIRRLCKGGVSADLVLGRHLSSAVISCLTGIQPNSTCVGQPTSVSLKVNGSSVVVNASGVSLPYSATLSASFRSAASQLTISGPTALPPGQVGVAYQTMAIAPTASPNLITAGSNAAATWIATGLPGGLTISSTTGTISGTPTVAGSFTVIITATDAAATSTTTYSTSASKTYGITISAALGGVGPASLPVGQAGVVYTSTQMTRTGGTAPYTWTQTGLPAGLSISSDGSGLISGTPTVSGSFTVNVTVTDAMTATITKPYTLTINAVLAISTVSLPNGQVGVAYSTTVASTGGTAPKTWSATGLPAGLTFNTSTATLSGTPTAATTATVVVTVTDAMTGTAQKTYTVVINATLAIATATLPNGQVGVAYSSTVAPSGGTAPYAWSATGLPTGLTISAAGLISGTPTVAGPFSAIVTVTDAIPTSANKTYAITIAVAAVTCPGAPVGWKAEYFANVTLSGLPVLCRDDANPISLDWASGSPDPTVPVDNFSVRWTRTQVFAAGYYTFTMGSDDGSRLYIDGALVVDSWADRAYATSAPYSVFVADGTHTIVMEFYERGGLARATLNWVASTPPACATAAVGWLGQYFSNVSLTGPPAACRDDADPLNFNWGTAAPVSGMSADDFSVRWTKTPTFTAGTYKFALGTDDGGRLYIDGVLVLNQWVVQAYPTPQPSITKTLTAGAHVIVVEFFTQSGSAQATLVVAPVSPPTTPTLSFSAFTNTYWSGAGSTVVFYRPTGATGSFTTTASSTDAAYGIASYAFPALGTNWTSTPGALGVTTYSWSSAPAAPGTTNVTATNNAGVVSANSPFTPTADVTAPTAGTVTYPNGTQATTSVSVSFTTGTDAGSGIGTRLLQRQSATLTGITCGTYGAFSTLANGTNPASPVADTVALGNCYKYQYVVSDNVGNLSTVVGASVVKVRNTYYDIVNATGGLLNYWRLGEAATSISTDTFAGTAGSTVQSHTGELAASWTKHAISSTTDAVITSSGRVRKNGSNTTGTLYYASAVPASANYRVEADVYVASTLANDLVGVVGRLNTASSSGTFYAAFYDVPSQKWTLLKATNGALQYFPQTTIQPLTAGMTYRLGLNMTGTSIQLLVNGVQQVAITDSTITAAGRAGIVFGFGSQSTTDTDIAGMQLDNFSVSSSNVSLVDNEAANTGSYVGGPLLGVAGALTVSGDTDTAAQFDGISDYGTVARQISGDFSIEFWFKSTAGGIAAGTQWWSGAGMVDAEVGNGVNDFGVSLRSDGKVMAGVGAGSDVTIVSTSASSYKDGSWHHVVFTRTMASGALQLYIDGAPAGSATGGTTALNGPSFINFGRLQSGVNYFAGSLDEIAIYNTVLTQATVTAHYTAA